MTTTSTSARWFGWLWHGGRWQRVCSAETMDACARQLHSIGGKLHVAGNHQVMTGGSAPDFTPARGKK
jgi:hypothetical protein